MHIIDRIDIFENFVTTDMFDKIGYDVFDLYKPIFPHFHHDPPNRYSASMLLE